jgi:hypothetical protein|tara:strand:+ start:110 stop:676 length:567 start_codon:yes stop_codon:yes gene_type:complete
MPLGCEGRPSSTCEYRTACECYLDGDDDTNCFLGANCNDYGGASCGPATGCGGCNVGEIACLGAIGTGCKKYCDDGLGFTHDGEANTICKTNVCEDYGDCSTIPLLDQCLCSNNPPNPCEITAADGCSKLFCEKGAVDTDGDSNTHCLDDGGTYTCDDYDSGLGCSVETSCTCSNGKISCKGDCTAIP